MSAAGSDLLGVKMLVAEELSLVESRLGESCKSMFQPFCQRDVTKHEEIFFNWAGNLCCLDGQLSPASNCFNTALAALLHSNIYLFERFIQCCYLFLSLKNHFLFLQFLREALLNSTIQWLMPVSRIWWWFFSHILLDNANAIFSSDYQNKFETNTQFIPTLQSLKKSSNSQTFVS